MLLLKIIWPIILAPLIFYLKINNFYIFMFPIPAIICAVIAKKKNRNSFGWFVCGFFTAFIGIIIIACLKKIVIIAPEKPKTKISLIAELTRYEELYKADELEEEIYLKEKERIEKEIENLDKMDEEYRLENKLINKHKPFKTPNDYINEVLLDYTISDELKKVQLKGLKKERKISSEEYKQALKRI